MLLLMCRHGLRASKTVRVGRQNLNLGRARVWIRRLENGLSIEPSIAVNELGAFKGYLHTLHGALPWLFVPERGQPMNRRQHSGQQVQHMGAPEDVARHAGVGSRTIAWHGLAGRALLGEFRTTALVAGTSCSKRTSKSSVNRPSAGASATEAMVPPVAMNPRDIGPAGFDHDDTAGRRDEELHAEGQRLRPRLRDGDARVPRDVRRSCLRRFHLGKQGLQDLAELRQVVLGIVPSAVGYHDGIPMDQHVAEIDNLA